MTLIEDRENRIYDKVNQKLKEIRKEGPYNARQLGILKSLDAVVELTGDDNSKKIDITLALQEHALIALPKNTAEVLAISLGGSGLALELVRRDLTEFSILVRVLYASTEEQRAVDDGLRRLYNTLTPIVELHGALVSAGVDVEEREWARFLARQIPNLRRLRSTPWYEVALVLKLITLDADDAEGGGSGVAGDANMGDNAFDGSTPWKNPPTRAEIRIVEELYAIGEGAPAIREQVLGVRLGLDVADQLEEMGIFDASTMTPEDARRLTNLATTQLDQEQDEATSDPDTSSAKVTTDREASPAFEGATPRFLPLLAGVAARLAPTLLRAAPKLSKLTKLTNLGGKSGISSMSNKLNALSSNNGGGGGGATANPAGGVATQALSGLVTNIKQVKEIKELLTPDVEAGVAAIELEKARLQATMDNVRQELERVSVAGESQEGIDRAQEALDKAKAAVAPIEGWQNRIASDATQALQSALQDQRLTVDATSGTTTSSYSSNEEIVAKASGGAALYGMNFFPTATDIVLKPYTPLLATPSYVEMTGAVANFEANVWQTTSVAKASSFHKISEHAGNSMAVRIATSEGGSASASTFFASGSGSSGKTDLSEKSVSEIKELERVRSAQSSTSTATVIEYIKCPMKSFRIPMARMQLSEDAYKTALEVNSIRDAEEFIDAYGSHVSNGRQELGGIFYSTITITSRELVNSDSMMSAASRQSSSLKERSSQTEVGGSVGVFGFGGKASVSFGKATSVGTTTVNTNAESSGTDNRELEARYQQYIRCTGPRAPTPETFADALFNDNSSWAVTDRGPIEALVPVTRVLENTIELLADDNEDKAILQSSVHYITAAWRIRATRWGDVLLDETNNAGNPDIPSAILDLLQTAYPIAQGVVQELVDAVYNALQFVPTSADTAFWGDPRYDSRRPSSDQVAGTVASAIRTAAQVATGGNSAPALLFYLDAEDAGAYVEKVMADREKANKADFFADMLSGPGGISEADLEAMWAKLRPSVRLGKFDISAQQGDREYFESLAPWEQRWIEKDDQFAQNGQKWEIADWEVFQLEYFKAGEASTFLPELERQLEASFFRNTTTTILTRDRGIVVRVVPVTTDENKALREAVTKAAQALTGEDWVIFRKIWTTDINSEETSRVMKIVEDHLLFMSRLYKTAREDSPEMIEVVADRDYLRSVLDQANAFRAAKAADAERIRREISAINVTVDPNTGEEDAEQVAMKVELERQLAVVIIEATFSSVEAFKVGITDPTALAELDRRFADITVEKQLSEAEMSVIKLKEDKAKAIENEKTEYFDKLGYFIDN